MTITYNRNIPDGPNNPSTDQPNMKTNTNSIDDIIAVDHQSFAGQNAGYHTIIHETSQLSLPTAIAGVNQLFAMIPPGALPPNDTQLFSLTGMNVLSQMTGSKVKTTVVAPILTSGYFWCAGFLIQFGQVSPLIGVSIESVYFPIPFPNNTYNIQATLNPNGSTSNAQTISVRLSQSMPLSRFSYNYSATSSTNYFGFFWIAIGN